MRRPAVVLSVVVPLLAAACATTTDSESTRSSSRPARSDCPRGVLYRASGTASVGDVLRAAQRNLSQVTLESQGTLYHLTPENAPIDFIEHGLAYDNRHMTLFNRATFGALTILRRAEAQCGRRLAEASWAIHYDVPVSVIAGPGTYVFFVKTKSGWRFWGDWCGAGQSKAWRKTWCV